VSGVPSRTVMTALILAAVVLGIAAGYWLFITVT